MKIAILGDPHFGVRGDSLDFHEYFRRYYEEHFFPTLEGHGVSYLIVLGDLFDRRKFINIHTLYLSRKYFFDNLGKYNIKMITILGNHDIYFKDTLEVNSPSLLLENYDIDIITSPETRNIGGRSFRFYPWNAFDDSQADICVGHFEVGGFQVSVGNEFKGGMKPEDFKNFSMVLSGHFHHKSTINNIHFLGTPTENTWGDYNDSRGFHILNIPEMSLDFIQSPLRMFHKIIYNDTHQDGDYWDSHDFSQYKGTYVKLVVLQRSNQVLFDNILNSLEDSGIADLKIIENSLEEFKEEIDNTEDNLTILGKYIDGTKTTYDKKTMKDFLFNIYTEAVSRRGE